MALSVPGAKSKKSKKKSKKSKGGGFSQAVRSVAKRLTGGKHRRGKSPKNKAAKSGGK